MAISFIKLNVPYRLLDSTADTYVMVDKVTSENIDVNTFVPKLSEIYFFPEENGYRAIKIGDGENTLANLPFAGSADVSDLEERVAEIERIIEDGEIGGSTELPTISGTVTKEIGGISKGKVYTNADITEVITDLLFPEVAPTWSSLTLYDASGSQLSSTYEYGTQITVAKFKPSFIKGSKNITSIKVGTSSGGSDLYSGTTAVSGTTYALTYTKTYNGLTTGTNKIYCTVSDGKNSASGNASISFAYHNYIGVTTSTTAPTSATNLINNGTSAEIANLPTQDNTYIWFLMPNTEKPIIHQYAMSQWNPMTTTYAGPVQFTTSTGKTVTYHAYRSDEMVSDSGQYCIAKQKLGG